MAKRKNAPVQEPDGTPEEDIALDLKGIKEGIRMAAGWVRSLGLELIAMTALLIIALAITLWIRLQPIGLGITDTWAENSIRQNLNAQFAQQVNQQFPNLPAANRDALVAQRAEEFITKNPGQYDDATRQLSQQLKAQLQYTAGGKEYTYLGDLDSYFWLRYTRNWLNTGTTCDLITADGRCRDTFVLAPVGVPSASNPSLHVFAIGWLHLLITAFDPEFPLTATSMYVPALLGLLGVIPAFFIGRRVAGDVGGFVAAVLIAANPMHLSRSMGSDNDGWNVLLPLWAAWMMILALEAKGWKRASAYAAGSAAFVGLHAATWAGWWMPYLILLLGAIGLLAFRAARDLVRGQRRPWSDGRVRLTLLTIGVFYLAALLTTLPMVSPKEYTRLPLSAVFAGGTLDAAVAQEYWPNVLTTVAELNKSSLGGAIGNFGGPLLFLGALAGMLLLLLPRKGWRFAHYAALAGGIAMYAYLVNADGLGKLASVALLGLPVAFVLLLDLLWGAGDDSEAHFGAALIILVWFLATTYATYSGVRFILIMVPAFGLGFGALAGRTHAWLTRVLSREFPAIAPAIGVIVLLVIGLTLVQPVKAGYGTARGFIPSIDDAWWDALTKIRTETAPDAIINSWWDFGHWFKYVAERRVTADGTTQHTHVPHWLGRALVTPDEREAVGILRMLDCGSDAYPQEEGKNGAYGIALATLGDPIAARNLVSELTRQDRATAERTLAGIDGAQRILERTHCDPPDDYFITSGDMIGKAGVWSHFGLWDFNRAFVAEQAREPQDVAVPRIAGRLNITEAEARALYLEVQQLRTPDGAWNEGAINQWIAPWPGYITGSWVGCSRVDDAIRCPGGIGISQQGEQVIGIDEVLFNVTAPEQSTVTLGSYVNGQRLGQQANATPAAFIIADERLRKLAFNDPTIPGIAIVIDVQQDRMLIASAPLAESLFTQLFYLDGRYSKAFVKFDDRTGAITNSRIITWKVNWSAFDE